MITPEIQGHIDSMAAVGETLADYANLIDGGAEFADAYRPDDAAALADALDNFSRRLAVAVAAINRLKRKLQNG